MTTTATAATTPELTRAEAQAIIWDHVRGEACAMRDLTYDIDEQDEVVTWSAWVDVSDHWSEGDAEWVMVSFHEHWPEPEILWDTLVVEA